MKTAVVFSVILCLTGDTSSVADTPPAESPPSWFVRIYKKCEEKRLCDIGSGTLISQHMVLTTAAIFFFKENMSSPQDIVVTWTCKKSGAVKFKVREIVIAPQYSGGESFHLHNLALLNLKTIVTATPAQIDFGPRLRAMTPGEMTMITDKDGHPLYNTFVNVDEKLCRDKLNGLPTSYITRDKFCFVVSDGMTVSVNGSSVTIQRDGVYYVKGVVSERKESVLLVTSLENKELLKWLQRKMLKFDRVHNKDTSSVAVTPPTEPPPSQFVQNYKKCDDKGLCDNGSGTLISQNKVLTKVRCEKKGGIYIYHCPNDTYCCDTVKSGCCQVFFTIGTTIVVVLLVILVVVATCTLCFWCIYTRYVIRRWEGPTYTHPAITVIQRDAQSSPQEQTDYCSPPLPLYPPKASYVGTPPPDYQRSTPNPAVNP